MTDDEKDDSLNDELYAEDDYDPDDDGFTIRDRLQAPTALQYTTRDLHTLIHEGIVDLNPPYQRGTPLLDECPAEPRSSFPQTWYGQKANKPG